MVYAFPFIVSMAMPIFGSIPIVTHTFTHWYVTNTHFNQLRVYYLFTCNCDLRCEHKVFGWNIQTAITIYKLGQKCIKCVHVHLCMCERPEWFLALLLSTVSKNKNVGFWKQTAEWSQLSHRLNVNTHTSIQIKCCEHPSVVQPWNGMRVYLLLNKNVKATAKAKAKAKAFNVEHKSHNTFLILDLNVLVC